MSNYEFVRHTICTKDQISSIDVSHAKIDELLNGVDIKQPFEIFMGNKGGDLNSYFGKDQKGKCDFLHTSFVNPADTYNKFVDYRPIIHYYPDEFEIINEETGCRQIMTNTSAYRNLNYLDSSIWHFMAWDVNSLCDAIKKIQKYEKYYTLMIACENANLNRRIFEQSIIHKGEGEEEQRSHSGYVAPFIFHSETIMAKKAIEIANNIRPIKRRILFLDDHSILPMNTIKGHKATLTKRNIIEARLAEIAELWGISNWSDIFELNCIETLGQISDLKKKRFDIIFIDYLLKETAENKSEYGYEVMKLIKTDIPLKQQKGPIGRYWMMFSSAFTYAVEERLLAEGYSHSDKDWYIGNTACPTTTPELFKYNLISLMKRQQDYITEVDEREDSKKDKQKLITLIDYLTYLFDDLGDVRIRAIDNFNSLLHLRSRYDRLKNDYYMGGKELGKIAKDNGSPLVQALFPDMNCYSNAFWEHAQHLVYLIAYGNILQWNEMWDEYIFVKENLKRAEIATESKGICKQIEAYIISIKSANFK